MTVGGTNEQEKLKALLKSTIQALREIEGLREDVKAYLTSIKEEFDIPPAKVRKAIKVIMKDNLEELKQELSDIEELVELEGKPPTNPMNT